MMGGQSLSVQRDCVVESKLQAETAVADSVDHGRWRSISARHRVPQNKIQVAGTPPHGAHESAAETECQTDSLLGGGDV